jgi:uncharacterized protein YrrD
LCGLADQALRRAQGAAKLPMSGVYSKTADELMGMEVVQASGENKVGEIDNIVRDGTDNSLQAVIAVDQNFGLLGEKKVVVAVNELELQDDRLVIDISEEPLKQRPEYEEES